MLESYPFSCDFTCTAIDILQCVTWFYEMPLNLVGYHSLRTHIMSLNSLKLVRPSPLLSPMSLIISLLDVIWKEIGHHKSGKGWLRFDHGAEASAGGAVVIFSEGKI